MGRIKADATLSSKSAVRISALSQIKPSILTTIKNRVTLMEKINQKTSNNYRNAF